MKSRLIDLDTAKTTLKPYLKEYLQSHGIDTEKNFRCLNPKHNDSSPSMTCKQVPDNAFCMGCGATVDIFQAAHYLEGKPIKGREYINENVMYLAEKFGVQLELQDLTPEEIYEYRTYAAYKLAAQLISDPNLGDYTNADRQIEARGWDKEKCAAWGIGTVSFDEYKATMKASGYEAGFLSSVDLDRANLFNHNNLLFTVYDDFGRPVGFSAKNLRYNKNDPETGSKYINTRGTGLECAIFKKGSRLYGFEIAKNAASPLYVFEGQADVITARHNGLLNCCCTLGTAMTDHHISLLKKHGNFNIILVFDGDEAGELAVQKAVDEKFAKERDFRVKLCQMPDGEDPDSLIRGKGIGEFSKLKKWSAFEWRMMRFMGEESDNEDIEEDKKREIAEKMAQIIVSEKSHIRQEEMTKQVAKATGYDQKTILSEVKRLRNEKEAEVQARKRNAIEALMQDVRHNPDEAELALVQAMNSIQDINRAVQGENTGSTIMNKMMSQKELDEAKTGEFAGFFMKPNGLGGIAARLDDDWRTDNLVFIGGSEQSGKCQKFDSPVNMPDGTTKTIEQVVRDKDLYVLGMGENKDLETKTVSNWIDSGTLECFKVTTEDGKYTEPSETHPYLTPKGWVEVKDLKIGDPIAVVDEGKVVYSKITEIKPIGEHQCYDLEVPDGHNFVVNDTIVHNTTLCSQMAYEIAEDPRNNAMCIYHSIDDASRFPTYKWVCNGTGDTKLKLNHVSSPKYWSQQDGCGWILAEREKGYKNLAKLMQDERLVIVDASDGQSITYAESLVKFYREKYPDRNIVLFIDNFHKLPDYAEMNGHERTKRLSNHVKNMTVANHITIVCTAEYRKLKEGEKPSNVAMAESRALQYDASVIIHLHNDLHMTNEEEAVLIHQDDEGNILPRIWVKFGKNKVSGYEGREFVDLFGYAGQVRAVDLETAVKDQRDRLQFLKENKSKLY
jgi:DNA primase